MYVYNCNTILTTAINNIGDKDMIQNFTELTEDLKSRRINPGFHLMDNEAYTSLNIKMTSMNINYQLVPPSNHRSNNTERAIHDLRYYFIEGLCSADKDFHMQLWYRILQQETIIINMIIQPRTLPHLSAYTQIFG